MFQLDALVPDSKVGVTLNTKVLYILTRLIRWINYIQIYSEDGAKSTQSTKTRSPTVNVGCTPVTKMATLQNRYS